MPASTTPLKLAVASKDNISINEHFGHAKRFLIFEASNQECKLIEEREVEHYCLGNSANQSAMPKILACLKDCHTVFVARIGEGPQEKLAAIGVNSNSDYAYEAVQESLLDYIKKMRT